MQSAATPSRRDADWKVATPSPLPPPMLARTCRIRRHLLPSFLVGPGSIHRVSWQFAKQLVCAIDPPLPLHPCTPSLLSFLPSTPSWPGRSSPCFWVLNFPVRLPPFSPCFPHSTPVWRSTDRGSWRRSREHPSIVRPSIYLTISTSCTNHLLKAPLDRRRIRVVGSRSKENGLNLKDLKGYLSRMKSSHPLITKSKWKLDASYGEK